MKKKNTKKGIIIIILALLVIAAGAFFLFQETKEMPTEKEIIEEEEAFEGLEISVYFFKVIDGEEEMVEVRREIPFTYETASASIRELLKGPLPEEKQKGISTAINEEVELQGTGINLDTNTAFVDFNERLQEDIAGSAQVTMIRNQIEKTLQQFENVEGVVISVEGDEDALRP